MKQHLKKTSLFILILFGGSIVGNVIPNREVIILLDTNNSETIEKTFEAPNNYQYLEILHPTGIGAITISLLTALYQQAAPIIAHKSLIKNIIDHQNLFSDVISLDRKTLHNKYEKHNRFRGHATLDNFRKSCLLTHNLTIKINQKLSNIISLGTKNLQESLNAISKDPLLQGSSYLETYNATQNLSYTKSVDLEMRMYLLCSWIDFDKDWDIKQVNEDIFLLIPKNYSKTLPNSFGENKGSIPKKDPITLSDTELKLGLKVDHLKTVKRNFFEQRSARENQPKMLFTNILELIFVTNQDLKKIGLSGKDYIWSVHMSGHGLNQHPQLAVLPQFFELKKFYTSKLTPKRTIKNSPYIHLSKKSENAIYAKKLRKLKHEIQKAKNRKNLNIKTDHSMINSLSIDEFRDTLIFLNDNINTAFLYYFSCFSAGSHVIEPYQKNGKPLVFNYTIMTGTPAENQSLQEFPFINLPPYFHQEHEKALYRPLNISDIDIEGKRLGMTSVIKFNQFFTLLRKGVHNNLNNLILLPYSLHPHVDQFGTIKPDRIANIPLVRLAHTNHFQPIPHDHSSTIIDTKNSSKDILLHRSTGLIYADHIQGTLLLNKLEQNQLPKLISMSPGFSMHVFEKLSSSTLTLNEIINSFLTFPDLCASKIFWIKQVESINAHKKTETFYDLIILRNVFNSNALELCSDEDPLVFENCAYFSNKKQESKLTWSGPFIDPYNYKTKPWNKDNHKEECLHYFPHAYNYINPVLKSI